MIDSIYDKVTQWQRRYRYDRLPVTRTRSSQGSIESQLTSSSSSEGSRLDKLGSSTFQVIEDAWDLITSSRPLLVLCLLFISAAAIATTVISALAEPTTRFLDQRPCKNLDRPGWLAQSSAAKGLQANTKRSIQPLTSQTRMSQACADLWIAKGELCESISSGEEPLGDHSIDVVWTYIDPSEHWQKWQAIYSTENEGQAGNGTGDKLFRSYNEIRSSIRSVVKNIPFVNKQFLLGTSLPSTVPAPDATLEAVQASRAAEACRLTQVPEWMDVSAVATADNKADSKLQLISYWELYNGDHPTAQEEEQWKERTLPTFNSHSIESQLSNVPSTSETLLYLNEDVFIGRPLSPADISTSLFGPIFRVYPASWIHGVSSAEEAMATLDGNGNARALPNTMRLLDERFGKRDRNYPDHTAYSLTRPIMHEVAQIWQRELKETAEVRFRGRGPEYWLPLLVMYYTIEKQREALLWSFFVTRSDKDLSGSYLYDERQAMLESLGGRRDGTRLVFKTPVRPTSAQSHNELLERSGTTPPAATEFAWSSQISYPYISKELDNETHIYPDFGESRQEEDFCAVSIQECFLDETFFDRQDDGSTISTEDIFKHVAFQEPKKCGDCIMAALLRQSGPTGFDAFLPPQQTVPSEQSDARTRETPPLLAMDGRTWHETDFSLKNALGQEGPAYTWDARSFSVRLIQRYSWTLGKSPTAFNELNDDPGWVSWFLWRMKEEASAFMGVNDHITTTNATLFEEVKKTFVDWQHEMWPEPSPYEKGM